MRAGNLDSMIEIQRFTVTGDDGMGNEIQEWVTLATLRAQLIQAGTEEFIRNYGTSEDTVIVFRTRYLQGVTNVDRVVYDGLVYDIKETKEIGRARGLEIRTISQGQVA